MDTSDYGQGNSECSIQERRSCCEFRTLRKSLDIVTAENQELAATLWCANDRIENLEEAILWSSKHIENVFALAGTHDREHQDYEYFLEISRGIERKRASKIFVQEQDSAGNLNP